MENNKKRSRLGVWFNRAFGKRNELSFLEEEQLQNPWRIIIRNFFGKKTAVFGLVMFFAILLFVLIGPHYLVLDLGYADTTQQNIAPGFDMMKVPKELINNGIAAIAPGNTYGFGADKNGEVYIWGKTSITAEIDLANIPDEVRNAKIVDIAAGNDHVVAIDDAGYIYVWGNDRLGQAILPMEVQTAMRMGKPLDIVQLEASNQFSAIVMSDGNLYLWGNGLNVDLKLRSAYQGHIKKVALTAFAYISLLDDGTVAYTGFSKDSPLSKIPEALNGKTVVDIASTSQTVAAVTDDGHIYVWGSATKGEALVPVTESKPIKLSGGHFHYTALMENGDVISWGDNTHKQATVPASVNTDEAIEAVYAGFLQNYAVTESGQVKTWGLKGYLCGTDNLGRDVLNRIVNGGRMTMTVGAISVIISTIIGVLLGGIAGYFGGRADTLIMRIAEIVGGLPFIPFAMILSAVIGTRISVEYRMYLIMVVLGILSWPGICRLVRAQMFAQREMEFVTAAKVMGVTERKIVFKHILPNVMSVLLVSVTLDFATCMLTESTLSYLGFGIPLPTPTWGNMLTGANNSVIIQQYWWRWVFPALIFGMCTICINLIGDGMRDAIDPKSSER